MEVGALGELGEVAKVGVEVHLSNGVSAAGDAAGDGEGTGTTLVDVDLHEVLHASLAGLVGELDGEVHLVGGGGKLVGGLAEVGGHLGVLERAIGGLGVAAEVLDAVVEAGAEGDGGRGAGLDGNTLENLVGKGAEGVLDTGSSDDVGGGSDDAISAPDAAIGVVVDHEELLAGAGRGGEGGVVGVADLDDLLHHGGLDGGERVIAVGGDAVRAVGAVVAKVALAALDLAGVPKLVEVAVGDVSVGVASGDVAGGETARAEVGVVNGRPAGELQAAVDPGGEGRGGAGAGGGNTPGLGEHDAGNAGAEGGTGSVGGVVLDGDVAAGVGADDLDGEPAVFVVAITAGVEVRAGVVGEGVGGTDGTSTDVKSRGAGNSVGGGSMDGDRVGGGRLAGKVVCVVSKIIGFSAAACGVGHTVTILDKVVEGGGDSHLGRGIGEGGEVEVATGSGSHLNREAANLAAGDLAGVGAVVAGAGGPPVGAGLVLEPVARAVAPVLVVAGELLDVLAGTVAGAGVGAGGTAAALALVAVEALALAGLAVADALVAALGVVVSLVGAVGGVSPSEGEGAGAKGAVGALEVLVARALVVGAAHTVAGAGVGAGG